MRNRWAKISVWIITMLVMMNTAVAQPKENETHQFSVQQAVEYGMKNSVQVKNVLLDIKKTQQVNREYTALALPQVSGSAIINDYVAIPTTLLPGQFFGGAAGTYIPVKFGTKYSATGSINLDQTLFDGQVFIGLQARSTNLKLSQINAEVTQEAINANIQKIYYQLVIGKMQMAKIDANIVLLEKLLHDTKEIYKNGFAEQLDVDKTTVALTNVQTEKVKVQNSMDAGNASLKFLMGMPQKDALALTDTLTEQNIKEDLLDDAYNYKDRKEVQALELANKLNAYNVRRYKLSYIPSLSAFASYSKNAQRTKFDIFDFSKQWFTTSVVGLRLNVPIFDGFTKDARMKQAKIDFQKTTNLLNNFKENVDMEVKQTRDKLKSAILTIDAQRKNMELAESVYNQTKKKYEQGLGSNTEINTTWKDLQVAQSDYYAALYDAIIAKVDYHKAIGKLQ
ncbi:MAG: TolC family protein [Sphingobacteriales bacterium]|nr:TolC family protein [Sphingobacteriales bacterium]MBI3718071.1 TolC family protein [Sphingobacteriales bacterium]